MSPNPEYSRILAAPDADRLALFAETARRIGTTEQNVEKDFWVCWTLDALFRRLPPGGPRLLFKGGTSLSKAFRLISRFSEDVDLSVFRSDLGLPAEVEDLERLSGKKRRARLSEVRDACGRFVRDTLRAALAGALAGALEAAGRPAAAGGVSAEEDAHGQTLLVSYPSVVPAPDPYVPPSVRVEAGARSAVEPRVARAVEPYAALEAASPGLRVEGVTTIVPERTFWDKVLILHGLRRWFERRGELRQEGHRVTRHYYDVHCLLASPAGASALANAALAGECVRHARMFFDRPDFDLASAARGKYALSPTPPMLERLERDYERMSGMILGPVPSFAEVMASVRGLEERLRP